MRIGKLKIEGSRWPWQGYGWFPHKNGKGPKAMLNPLGSRFGAGWNYKLGICLGGRTLMIDLVFGTLRVSWG